jgi:hypothetical protein
MPEQTIARKPTHFSKMSLDRSGEKMMSPARFPSIMIGNEAPTSGMVRRLTNHRGTRPSGVRTSTGSACEDEVPAARK